MEDSSEKPNPKPRSNLTNQNYNNKMRNEKKKMNEFEFWKVCKLNHNQGTRHKYFPNHKNSLSAFPSWFQNKINDIRFFLKNATVLRPEYVDRNRFWCVFCDIDVDELHSSFACENAINHLAGMFHLKNLKHFLWQYGVGTDCLDAYRILETDVTKWEKKCKSLKTEAVAACSEGSCGVYNTNEFQISNSIPEVAQFGSNLHEVNSSLLVGECSDTSLWNWNDLKANSSSQQNLLYKNGICSGNAYLSNDGCRLPVSVCSGLCKGLGHPYLFCYFQSLEEFEYVCQVNLRKSTVNGESSSHGLKTLTQVALSTVDAGGNVHSGAPLHGLKQLIELC
ncbi:hypothetical protein PTKIN_Ptkin05aG0201500 [Pterospermum kingtungense]